MEEIKPKKERKFLKAMGDVAITLFRELLLNVGKKVINKSGNKRQGLVLASVILASTFVIAQYPTTNNKQRLGFQTTADGLVYRGRSSDTVAIKSSGLNNAYFILDTVNNIQYNYIKTKGGWQFSNGDTIIINNNFSQPVDSLFFNVGVPTNNVDTAKMRWDSDLATVVLGLNDNVPNELGFKNFWLVKNQTGSTITKGSLVYANGTVGASGRITVAKFIADGLIDAKYLLGITAHDLSNGEDGYVISFGKIRQVNTDTFAAGAILYPSPTVAGVWTDVEPVAPNIDMPIGFCINSSSNNGTIAIRVASGYKLNELHDVQITSPVDKASLYYKSSEGLWRDTTGTLLVSDTASMLTNYLRTGVAASTYQTKLTNPITGTGTINYLPKFTSTGSTIGSSALINNDNYLFVNPNTQSSFGWDYMTNTSNPFIGSNVKNGTSAERLQRQSTTSLFYPSAIIFGYQRVNNSSSAVSFGGINFMTTDSDIVGDIDPITYSRMFIQPSGNIGIGTMQPSFKLDIQGTLNATGATTLSSTLSVTGETTLSNLAGTGSRMVIAGSSGLLSTQAIPTGTVTSVGGTGTVNGISLTGTVTSSGNLTLGGTLSGVSLSSQVTGTLPIANGGTGATTAAAARTALGATVRGANTFILPDLGAISFLRYNPDNTVSQRGADGMRTDLGGTTIGQSMFTLANPSAIRFPRFNADNTVSALDATTFRTAIGAGTGDGNGTVTSVTGTAPISVANTTTTPLITIANAGISTTGVVTASTQTFGGAKTFNGALNASSELAVTGISNLNGGATIGTMTTTSTLTHILGVNSSNAIGEIALGSGLNLSAGVLNLGGFVSAFLDFPSTSAQSSSDLTVSYTGAQTSHPVILSVPDGSAPLNTNYTAWVSSAGVVKVRFNNYSASAVNPASGTFTIFVLNL
jgi:hypothetical protein